MSNTKRLFLAIPLKAEGSLRYTFNNLQDELAHECIKWIHQKQLHLTLKFFGETPVQEIDEIVKVVEVISNSRKSFKLGIEKLGIFGSSYQPKVIWAGISKTDELVEYEKDMMHELEQIGYKNDQQNFIPHITLGRIRMLKDKKLFQKIINKHKESVFQVSEVHKIILYESVLKSRGAVHHVVHEFPLL